eukprot:5692912-Pyramimonas_sp.AAC.1
MGAGRGGQAKGLKVSWMPLGASCDISWALLGGLLGPLGGLSAVLEGSWASRVPRVALSGLLWVILGPHGGLVGPSGSHLGAILGPRGASWAPLMAILEEIDERKRRSQFALPLGSHNKKQSCAKTR